MILNTLEKLKTTISETVESLINEDLKTIVNINQNGIDNALSSVLDGSKLANPINYLRVKVLDGVKDFKIAQRLTSSYLQKQLNKLDVLIENPFERRSLIQKNLFKVNNPDNYISVNSFTDIKELHSLGDSEHNDLVISGIKNLALKGIKKKIMNPFNGIVMNLELKKYEKTDPYQNQVIKIDEYAHDINKMHIIQIETHQKDKLNLTSNEDLNNLLGFEFTVYHELAHTTYNQISKKDETKSYKGDNEIHSDISAIIKMIKNHDLSKESSIMLCKSIFEYRTKTHYEAHYFEKNVKTRDHFTELSIIDFSNVLEKKLDLIKSIPDNEIADFVEILIAENNKVNKNYLPNIENKEYVIDKLLNKYFDDVIGNDFDLLIRSFMFNKGLYKKMFTKMEFDFKDYITPEQQKEMLERVKINVLHNMKNDDKILMDIYMKVKINENKNADIFYDIKKRTFNQMENIAENVFNKFNEYKEFQKIFGKENNQQNDNKAKNKKLGVE